LARKEQSTKKKSKKVTPLMQQYFKLKDKYKDAILLFRVGDFYETFGEDAITASQVLGIILTRRNNGGSDIELAGFPYHSLDLYLPRLVRAGYRVAIGEQLEKPSKEKKLVKRGVTEVVTPGVAINDKLLDHKQNNFLAVVANGKKGQMGVAFVDVSTGEFLVSEGGAVTIDKLLNSFQPSEVLYSKDRKKDFTGQFGENWYANGLEEWIFSADYAREQLLKHFDVHNLKGFGVEEMPLAQMAAGVALHYLAFTEKTNLKHIAKIARIQADRYVWLDRFTIRNLELVNSPHETGVSLLQILDKTISPMGARLMKKWVLLPLKDRATIYSRLAVVQCWINNASLR